MGPEANIIVVPFLKLVLKQMDVVGDAVLAEQLVKLQWKLDWNSTPLSVWIMSALKGSLRATSSTKLIRAR